MNIISKSDIKKIISERSRYQKVMLLYDDTVSSIDVSKIHDEIKELCIYNQLDIRSKEIECQVNDGYRTLIYFCSVDNFLTLNIDRKDFINIYIPTETGLLPYYINSEYELSKSRDYIVLNAGDVDVAGITSIYFNKCYNYLRNLLLMRSNNFGFNFSLEVTNSKLLEEINNLNNTEMTFADIELISNCNISYQQLPLVDYILISALSILISSVRSHSLSMVDVYKSAGEDYALIDKFYAMYCNESLIGLINLNFYCLSTAVDKTRDKLLEILSLSYQYDQQEIDIIIDKIKNYCKNDSGILGYLYLYNIFSI